MARGTANQPVEHTDLVTDRVIWISGSRHRRRRRRRRRTDHQHHPTPAASAKRQLNQPATRPSNLNCTQPNGETRSQID
jgi:hypothetical protein